MVVTTAAVVVLVTTGPVGSGRLEGLAVRIKSTAKPWISKTSLAVRSVPVGASWCLLVPLSLGRTGSFHAGLRTFHQAKPVNTDRANLTPWERSSSGRGAILFRVIYNELVACRETYGHGRGGRGAS